MSLRFTPPRAIVGGLAMFAVAGAALTLTGCLSEGIGNVTRSMVRDGENEGPGGVKSYDTTVPYFRKSRVLAPNVTTYTIGEIPKGYEVLLDTNLVAQAARQNSTAGADLTRLHYAAGTGFDMSVLGAQAEGKAAVEVGQEGSIGDNPNALWGAAVAARAMKQGNRYAKETLARRVDQGGQVTLKFVHEVVGIEAPKEDVQLEPFGKVLSVTTANGEVISETREPVYTVTVPTSHRLVVQVVDPAQANKVVSQNVYAVWSKDVKYYRNQDKKFFKDEAEALASYTAEKSFFAKQVAEGPLFDKNKPKALKDLPVQNLTVMSPEDLNGAVIRSPSTLNFMLPNKGDKATERIKQAMAPWVTFGELSATGSAEACVHFGWISEVETKLATIAAESGVSAQAKACIQLNLGTLAAMQIEAEKAERLIGQAQQTHADVLGKIGSFGSGGALDYGSYYYEARGAFLSLANNVRSVDQWVQSGVRNAVVNPR